MKYKIQFFDTDIEDWQDMDIENNSFDSKYEAEQEARYESNKCSYKLKTRIVSE